MSIKPEIDQNYVVVSSSDIIRCMRNHHEEEEIFGECKEIFLNHEIEDNCFKLSFFHPVVVYLKKEREDKYYIDASILKDALAIAISENNYEMQKKLTRHFRKYMDNERNGITNTDLMSEIISDEEEISFIKKYFSFESYEQDLIQKSFDRMQKQLRLEREKQVRGKPIL